MDKSLIGAVGVVSHLKRLNRAHRKIEVVKGKGLEVVYKTSPVALRKQLEHLNNIAVVNGIDNKVEYIEAFENDLELMAIQLLQHKDDLGYQELIIEFITEFPDYKDLF